MPAFAPELRCLDTGRAFGEVVCDVCDVCVAELGVVEIWKVVGEVIVVAEGGIDVSYETCKGALEGIASTVCPPFCVLYNTLTTLVLSPLVVTCALTPTPFHPFNP